MTAIPMKFDYAGNPFGSPAPKFLSKSWRIKYNVFASRYQPHASALLGQDSIGVTSMSPGLAVYCGYEAGTLGYASGSYDTMPEVYRVWPGKKYISVGLDCIDIEPGLASPGDGPGFVRGARPPHAGKPVVYCSAGDLGAVIGALDGAGIPRSAYYLWSAHWIGEHICGPSTCGYPQCDATQYASNNSFDSDVFSAYVFGAPLNPTFPLKPGDRDVTAQGPVHKLQERLNAWRTVLHTSELQVDGDFGLLTRDAVGVAQRHFKQRGVTAGTCTSDLMAKLNGVPGTPPAPPPPVKPPLPVSPAVTGLRVSAAGAHSVKFEFQAERNLPVQTDFQVKVVKDVNGKFGETVYTRVIHYSITGAYGEQYGGLEPDTKYILIVRSLVPEHAYSKWAEAPFVTAK